MAELKTKENSQSVKAFLNKVENENKRNDSFRIAEIMEEITGAKPKMWGDSIVGFGKYHYKYASGREGDWFQVGFSPRKQNLVLYITPCFENSDEVIAKLGKIKSGKACFYLKRLSDVDETALRDFIKASVDHLKEKSN